MTTLVTFETLKICDVQEMARFKKKGVSCYSSAQFNLHQITIVEMQNLIGKNYELLWSKIEVNFSNNIKLMCK